VLRREDEDELAWGRERFDILTRAVRAGDRLGRSVLLFGGEGRVVDFRGRKALGIAERRNFRTLSRHLTPHNCEFPSRAPSSHQHPISIMVSPQAIRRFIMTASITIITASGAIYGAGLKSDQELKQVRYTSLTFKFYLQQPSHHLISRDKYAMPHYLATVLWEWYSRTT